MNRRDAAIAVGLGIGTLALLLPLASIGVDQHHDGIMLKPAFDVLTGQVLFRDSFTQYGALTCYLQAGALAVSRTLLAVRVLNVVAIAATLFFHYAAWRLLLPRSLAIVSCVLFVLFLPAYEQDYWNHQYWMLLPWSSVFAMLFQCLGLYALFRMIRNEQPAQWSLVLGLACAGVFWCRQPVGLMMAGSLIVIWPALLWTGWKPAGSTPGRILGRMAGGFLGVNALLFGGMLCAGALPEWWEQNIVWPGRWSDSMQLGDTILLTIHPLAGAGLVALLAALALPAWVKRSRPALPAWVFPVYFLGLGAGLLWQHERVLPLVALREGGWGALFPLIILVQAAVSIVLALLKRPAPRTVEYYAIAAVAAIALGSLLQYYPMADSWHVFYALAPTFGLFVFALWRWSGWPAPAVAGALTVLFLPALWGKAMAIAPALNRPLVTLDRPAVLRGMKVPPAQAHSLEQVADTLALILRYRPDLPGALIGNNALYLCFLNNHTNPTPYYVTWRGLASQTDNLQRWKYIKEVRPLMILQSARWGAVDDFYHESHYVPLLYVDEEQLEIAVPQELAAAMGVTAYGAIAGGKAKSRP